MKTLLMIVTVMMAVNAHANGASDVREAIKAQIAQLNETQQAELQSKMIELQQVAEQRNLVHQTAAGADKKSTSLFTCAAGTGNLALVGGSPFLCTTTRGEVFTMSTLGVQLGLESSVSVVLGLIEGAPENGIHEISLNAGAYYKLGGMVLVGGPVKLVGVGVGLGGHLNFGVPRDSLVGGQLQISIPENSK